MNKKLLYTKISNYFKTITISIQKTSVKQLILYYNTKNIENNK